MYTFLKPHFKFSLILFRNVFILFVLLEISLGFFFNYLERKASQKKADTIINSNVYQTLDPTVVTGLLKELSKQEMKWKPYVHYGLKPMQGHFNTITNEGKRITKNTCLKAPDTALKVFCFGGSTMYGSGARDAYTIPSLLSKHICDSFPNANVELVNFACHGYTRATEHIQLQNALIKGHIPDLVIFYDGVNDVVSSHQNNEAGLPINGNNRKTEFNITLNYKKRISFLFSSSNIYKLIKKLQLKIAPVSLTAQLQRYDTALAQYTAENYSAYTKLSQVMGKAYGFSTYNFLQPNVFTKKQLAPAEKKYHTNKSYYKNLYQFSF